MNVRTMPKTIHQKGRSVIARATSSTPIAQSSIASLGYNSAQQSRLKLILANI